MQFRTEIVFCLLQLWISVPESGGFWHPKTEKTTNNFDEAFDHPAEFDLIKLIDECPLSDPDCTRADRSIYRTYDGSCNNEEVGQRSWGMANTAQVRILGSEYEDGIGAPRVTGKSGVALPNARQVSTIINNRFVHVPSPSFSHMLMQYGQFLTHDLAHTDAAQTTDESGDPVDINCDCDVNESSPGYKECFNIEVPADDHTAASRTCLPVIRSAAWPQTNCFNDQRQQVNSVTAFIDCSQVYGSRKGLANNLRDDNTERGKLNTTDHPTHPEWKPLLPYLNKRDQRNDCASDEYNCFLAGDERRNTQPGLMAMHTIWVRAHNYIEEQFHAVNPHWDGETLYQEARRTLIAITQHITYNEYLKELLGRQKMREELPDYGGLVLGVDADSQDYETVYDASVQPNIANLFSTAAFRVGHSSINKYLKYLQFFAPSDDVDCNDNALEEQDVPLNCIKLRNTFNNPTTIYENPSDTENVEMSGIDSILIGLLNDPGERMDLWYTEEINDYLFTENPDNKDVYGHDLFALTVQRGRDHGLPSYMDYRAYYDLSVSISWDDQPENIEDREWEKLQETYQTPEDIEVYTGGLLETHKNGSKMGDLFAEATANQFMRLKIGDRFWYENGELPTSLTLDQLVEVRRMTLSGLLCVTMDSPGLLPQKAFELYLEDESNPLLPCQQDAEEGSKEVTHPVIDFTKWQI